MTHDEEKKTPGADGVGEDARGRSGEERPARSGSERSALNRVERVEMLLQELEPVDLPPFYKTRLLARVREAGSAPAWRHHLRAPQFAWSVAALCVVALVIVVVNSGRTTPPGMSTPVPAMQMVGSTIDPVAPAGNSVVGAGDVEIVAAIYPPIEGAIVRLYVDERDVTGLAEVTESYVMYSPSERFTEGEHIVTIEITDASGLRLKDVSWLFYTLNGRKAASDPRT